MTERQKFHVVQKFKNFELRTYEPCIVAEVEMSEGYRAATQGAFRYLFNYISRGNGASASISKTAPVLATTQNTLDSKDWKVSFVMPTGSMLSELPLPSDTRVTLREIPAENCVALSFRGWATKSLSQHKEDVLRASAHEELISLSQETRICRFDPPFKPGFMQYNEIVIPTNTSSM